MAVEGRAGWEQANMKGENSFNNGFKIQQIRFKTVCIKQNWCTFFTIYKVLFSLDICNILSCCTMAFFSSLEFISNATFGTSLEFGMSMQENKNKSSKSQYGVR